MEFLRFGSSIPGAYYGCCAVCIIQEFKQMPTDAASIELVDGDGGHPIQFSSYDSPGEKRTGSKFYGKTYGDIFRQRIRAGTFNTGNMPNHVFLAVLTEYQIGTDIGKAWLKILKEEGFEFVRTTDNSVYTGTNLATKVGGGGRSAHKNYIFGLFRNIGAGSILDTFTPPEAWTKLDSQFKEPWEHLTDKQRLAATSDAFDAHKKMWENLPEKTFYSAEELEAEKIPVIRAGKRSRYPQQRDAERKNLESNDANLKPAEAKRAAPFKAATVPPVAA